MNRAETMKNKLTEDVNLFGGAMRWSAGKTESIGVVCRVYNQIFSESFDGSGIN